MGIWPFITIFVSLLLVLFFRRIDKRTINFNKFKKYSEKLSADFENYLKGKREEIKSLLREMEKSAENASRVISRIEAGIKELEERIADYDEEKRKLESLKSELDSARNAKTELEELVNDINKNIPDLKKLSRRVKRIGTEIIENEKLLKKASGLIPEIERKVKERTDEVLEDVRNSILDRLKEETLPVVDEYRQHLDLLRSSFERGIEEFRRETRVIIDKAAVKLREIDDTLGGCRNRVNLLESEVMVSIENRVEELNATVIDLNGKIQRLEKEAFERFSKKAEEEFRKYLGSLEESREILKQEIFKEIEDRAKDLSSYVAKLEGRVNSMLSELQSTTEKYEEVLSLKARANESEFEALKNRYISEINEEASKNLLRLKPLIAEINKKFEYYNDHYQKLNEKIRREVEEREKSIVNLIGEFKNEVEGRRKEVLTEINSRIKEMNEFLDGIKNEIENRVGDASKEVANMFINKIKKYSLIVSTLEGRVGDLEDITRSGQKLIEERIEQVFSDYKPEIIDKIEDLRREMDVVFEKEKESINRKIEEIISRASIQLEREEEKIRELIESNSETIEESNKNLDIFRRTIEEELEELKIGARDELLREIETLKQLFADERDKTLARYSEDIRALEERISQINSELREVGDRVKSSVEEAIDQAKKYVEEIETSYLKTGEELEGKVKERFAEISDEIEKLREEVSRAKDRVISEIEEESKAVIERGKEEIARQKEVLTQREKELFELIKSLSDSSVAEIERHRQDVISLLTDFRDELEIAEKRINSRMKSIEDRIASFEKETSIIRKAERFREKVQQDIERFSEMLSQLKEDKQDLQSLNKMIEKLKRDEGDISARIRQLKGEKRTVNDIAKNAEKAIGLISMVEEKIKFIENERELLNRIEDEIKEIQERFKELSEKAQKLSEKEEDISVSVEAIAKTKELVENVEKRTKLLIESFEEIKSIEADLKNRIGTVEERTRLLEGKESRIEEVLKKFQEMDALVQDIEARSKQLQNAREWLARTESRLVNLISDAEKLSKELEQRTGFGEAQTGKKEGKPRTLSRESESKIKTVLTLFDQKWTIPEICRVTKMSRGEVELILELNNR